MRKHISAMVIALASLAGAVPSVQAQLGGLDAGYVSIAITAIDSAPESSLLCAVRVCWVVDGYRKGRVVAHELRTQARTVEFSARDWALEQGTTRVYLPTSPGWFEEMGRNAGTGGARF